MKISFSRLSACAIAMLLSLVAVEVQAHGEHAQMPGLRMRTLHWFDTEMLPKQLKVNENLVIKGKFVPSEWWPEHVPSISGAAFLNVGVPGPTFVRLDSRVNGVPMIRSTSFQPGETYAYEIILKARMPGRYHVHPVMNVKDAGPLIGPGLWIDVGGRREDFVNTATTMLGEEIDLETYGLDNVVFWAVLWFAIGIAWFVYWLTKMPIVLSRYKAVDELGDDADSLITTRDRFVAAGFLVVTLGVILGGYIWADKAYPITTPLQTGMVHVPPMPKSAQRVEATLKEAHYRIPGRSFRVQLTVYNGTSQPVSLGEFNAANLRFANPDVITLVPQDERDLIAVTGLTVDTPSIAPGKTVDLVFSADDALWETERLTSLIYDPDSRFAAMLTFFDPKGGQYKVEIGGQMLPVFNEE